MAVVTSPADNQQTEEAVSVRLEQLLAAVKRDPETAARLLIDMGEALSKRELIDYEHGLWRTATLPERKARALLASLDALGKDTA